MLLTSRDLASKGQGVLEEIRSETKNDALELFVGDLSSMEDVRRIAQEVRDKHPELDVLVNNAGGLFNQRQTTVDGFEMTFAFNHLAYFLLTTLLLPSLKAAGDARVVTSYLQPPTALPRCAGTTFSTSTRYSGWFAYGQSKLMNVLFANALARRLTGHRT